MKSPKNSPLYLHHHIIYPPYIPKFSNIHFITGFLSKYHFKSNRGSSSAPALIILLTGSMPLDPISQYVKKITGSLFSCSHGTYFISQKENLYIVSRQKILLFLLLLLNCYYLCSFIFLPLGLLVVFHAENLFHDRFTDRSIFPHLPGPLLLTSLCLLDGLE